MKRLALFLLLAFFQINAHADKADFAIAEQAFMNDEGVQAAIASAQEQNCQVDSEMGTLYLSGSCGYAGCFDTYMVSVGIHEKQVINPQSRSVIAKITLMNSRVFKIELLDCNNL